MLLFLRQLTDSMGDSLPDMYMQLADPFPKSASLATVLHQALCRPQTEKNANYNRRSLLEKLLLNQQVQAFILADAHYDDIDFVISEQSMLISVPKTGESNLISDFINQSLSEDGKSAKTAFLPPVFMSKNESGMYLNSTEAMTSTFFGRRDELSTSKEDIEKLIALGESTIAEIENREQRDMPNIRAAIVELRNKLK